MQFVPLRIKTFFAVLFFTNYSPFLLSAAVPFLLLKCNLLMDFSLYLFCRLYIKNVFLYLSFFGSYFKYSSLSLLKINFVRAPPR